MNNLKLQISKRIYRNGIYSLKRVKIFDCQKLASSLLVFLLVFELVAGVFLFSPVLADDPHDNPSLGQNWVRDFLAQNPEFASMEITGRTESSITFKDKDGKLITQVASFPIHYKDKNGEWQPIDTTLVYFPDTDEYGAGGLYTRIKPDGTVRITDNQGQTIHTQRTAGFGKFNADTKEFSSLGTFAEGSANGDTLTRSIADIEHKLKLTDLGLKEELILPNPLTGISPNDLVAMETEFANTQLFPDGWLGDTTIKGYQFPKPNGWDATGASLPLKRYARFIDGKQYIYTGILGSSLTGVAYPITIDPDYLDSTNDGHIWGDNTVYATARLNSAYYDTGNVVIYLGQNYYDADAVMTYSVTRGFLNFDTSAIPDSNIVTQVNLKMVCIADFSVGADFDVQIVKQDWSAQDPISDLNREAVYDNCLAGTADDNIWRNTSGMSVNIQYASGNLNTSWVSKTGNTYYSLRSSRDYGSNQPTGNEYINIGSQDHTTVAYRPILTVLSSSNTAPDAPTSLAQYKSDCSTSISTGGWTNETAVCLKGYINDPDTNDQVKLQLDYTTGTFDNIADATSTAWCTDPCTASTTISGLSHGSQYKWQGRSIDDDLATSAWAQFNSGAVAFGVDTSTPNIVAVDAGASSGDRTSLTSDTWFKYSDTGSDDQISFSWTDPSSASDDTFYYELNADSGNTIDGTEASTTNPYIDSITVSEGTNYFHVKPKNGAGTYGTERTFTVKYDKTAPTNVSISGITADSTTQLTVTASTATDAGSGLHATPYYFSQNSGSPNSSWQAGTTWANSSLSANTQYTYIVRARDTLTNTSASSTSSSKYTLASQVSSLSAANVTDKTSYKINLTWTNQSQSGMKIEQDTNCDGYETTLYNNASTNATSPYEVSASASTCYKFRISSYNGDGTINTTSIPETSQITTPPSQPTGLTHTSNTTSTINWDWNDVSGATGYKVYNSSDVLLQTINTATSNWTQDSLSADTLSTVYVRATNANGEGIASSNASAYTSANIPISPSHSTNTTDSITWTWLSGGAQKDYYAWTTSPADNSGWITGASWAQSSLTANSTYTFYIKARNENLDETSSANSSAYTSQNTPTDISFDSIATDSITLSAVGTFNNLTSGSAGLYFLNTTNSATPDWVQTNSWTNSSLSPNVQYTYQVKARNGDSDETSYCTATSTYTLANVPSTPTFSNVSTSTLKVILGLNSNPAATAFAIYENSTSKYVNSSTGALDQGTANWQNYTSWGGASGMTITGLGENTSYTFKAKARNGNNTETTFSSTAATTTLLSPPTAPSDANLDTITTTSMRLTWTDNASTETGFKIEQSADGSTYTQIDTTTANIATYSITSLTCNTLYYFRVRAFNTGGNSDYSTTNNTTSACPASCGDGTCNGTETCSSCSADCGVCPSLGSGIPGSASGGITIPEPRLQTISPDGIVTYIKELLPSITPAPSPTPTPTPIITPQTPQPFPPAPVAGGVKIPTPTPTPQSEAGPPPAETPSPSPSQTPSPSFTKTKTVIVPVISAFGEILTTIGFQIEKGMQTLGQGIQTVFIKTPKIIVKAISDYVFSYFTPMQITNVKVIPLSSTSVEITWQTNHKATTKVNYGLSREYDQEWQDSSKTKQHTVILRNLKPDTEYHYEVMSQNKNFVYDADRMFRTKQK